MYADAYRASYWKAYFRCAKVWHALSRDCTVTRLSANVMNHTVAFVAEAGPRYTDPGKME